MEHEAAQKHLARLIALCDAAGLAGIAFASHDLTDDERGVITQCGFSGLFRVRGADNFPTLWLEVQDSDGRWRSLGNHDHAAAAITLSAFERLCRKGYIQHTGEAEFSLSGEGFKVAIRERPTPRLTPMGSAGTRTRAPQVGIMRPDRLSRLGDMSLEEDIRDANREFLVRFLLVTGTILLIVGLLYFAF